MKPVKINVCRIVLSTVVFLWCMEVGAQSAAVQKAAKSVYAYYIQERWLVDSFVAWCFCGE